MHMKTIERDVQVILDEVKKRGDAALRKYTKKFDRMHIPPSKMKIPAVDFKRAFKSLPKDLRKALIKAERSIEEFYRAEKKNTIVDWLYKSRVKTVGQKWIPLDSVGIYVPGGAFSYPSTVLMAAIPARVAGVKRIAMISPPQHISDSVLAAAWITGITEFYRVGGPAGIAGLAYGTKTIKPVDKIIGPGNEFVTTAKKLLYGTVGIDMLAGPSEIMIIADNPDDAELIVQDLRSQKEHGRTSRAVLVSLDRKLTRVVRIMDASVELYQVHDIEQAVKLINRNAPEHVELMTKDNNAILKMIRSSGAVFVGKNTPVAIGDYIAGPSHILPTGRTARFSSGLSVMDFYRKVNIIRYHRCGAEFDYAARIARAEGMSEHVLSLTRRIDQ